MKTNTSGHRTRPKTELRVSLVLAFAVAFTAFALWISSRVSREKMAEMADIEVEKEVNYLNAITNTVFLSSEWIVCSFLSAWADVQFDSIAADGKLYVHFSFSDEQLDKMKISELSASVRSFLNYNQEFNSSVLIFEPDVLAQFPEGVSCRITKDTVICNPESGENAYCRSEFYERTARHRGMTTGAGKIHDDGRWVMTNAVAFYDVRGRRLGECWVDAPLEYMSGIIRKYQSETDVFAGLINGYGVLISCSDTTMNGLALEVTSAYREGKYSDGWCREVRSRLGRKEKNVFKDKVFGQPAYTFVIPVLNYPFKLLIVKPEGGMYQMVYKLQKVHWVIMSVGILVVMLCLVYIYLIIKKKNREKHLIEAELNVAASIQQRILPPNPSVPLDCRLEVYGFQRPAKSVGGDLYDFFLKDDRLYFCIGDVSGKGVPAAMVMSEVCSLYRSIIRQPLEVQEAMVRLNRALMERGDDSMFCTLLLGVLDLETGHLEYCNAGHNPPVLIRGGKADYLKVRPNMMLYAFEDYAYRKESLELMHGDRIVLYTDGITEAKNGKDVFFGELAALEAMRQSADRPFKALVEGVCESISRFAQNAEQHDDMSLLCIGYRKAGLQRRLHYDSVKNVVAVVNEVLDACSRPDDMRLRLAIEELVQNISDYAYAEDGPLDVEIIGDEEHTLLEIILKDSGKPFNPLEMAAPDLSVPIEVREIGGLGIYFARQIMEEINYIFENQKNKLTLKYKINENQCNGKQ